MRRLVKAGQLAWRLKNAEALGYARGAANRHYEPRTLRTGAEYIAWLRGWRRGQVHLKTERAGEAAELANTERIMRNLLREAA